jgi:hypothetical protein
MVVMFGDCCVGGGRYFPYYSYQRNPTGQEFFDPARTLIEVKLLRVKLAVWCLFGTYLILRTVIIITGKETRNGPMLSNSGAVFLLVWEQCSKRNTRSALGMKDR